MKFTIDRNVWLRGEGSGQSYLKREGDGKMCCVGIFLKACGLSDATLMNAKIARDLRNSGVTLPTDYAAFLTAGPSFDVPSTDIGKLYETNDDSLLDQATREQRISEAFARNGVEVEFIN